MKAKHIFLLALLALTACNDEELMPSGIESGSAGVTVESLSGKHLYIFNPWEEDVAIKLPEGCVPELHTAETRFAPSVEVGEKGNTLHLVLHDTVAQRPFLTKIPLRMQRARSVAVDTIYVVCRANTNPDVSLLPYQKYIGHTLNITGSIFGVPGIEEILNTKLLVADGQLEVISNSGSYGYGKTNMDYEEMQSSMWEEIGVSGFFSKGSFGKDKLPMTFSATFNQHFEKDIFMSNKYEFHYDNHVKSMVKAFVKSYVANASDPSIFLPYLTDEAAQLLNDSGSAKYQMYPNTERGIHRLYDAYGTHVLVGGVFGGRYLYLYGRKENYYMESVANSASVELSAKIVNDAPANENWLQTYYRVMGAHKGTIKAGGGNSNTEISGHMDEASHFFVTGGNASTDIESWDKSIKDMTSQLVPVSYCNRDALGNVVMNGAADSYVIPLYTLSVDPARRDSMKKYLDSYIENNYVPLREKPQLVVADFMMKKGKNDNEESAKTKVFADPKGTERPYFPLVGNKYVPGDAPEGAMLETSSEEYIGCSDETDQLWWVALAYEDECDPVTHIAFVTKDEAEKYSYATRGDCADSEMNYPDIDNKYVGLQFKSGHPDEAAVTGIGIYRLSNDLKQWYLSDGQVAFERHEYGYVIASTPGTDMLKPYYASWQQKQFESYWGKQPDKLFNALTTPFTMGLTKEYQEGYVDENTQWNTGKFRYIPEGAGWWGNCGAANADNVIVPVYTTKPLAVPLVYQKPRQFWNKEEDIDADDYTNN